MKKDILSEIIANKRFEVDLTNRNHPFGHLTSLSEARPPPRSTQPSLAQSSTGIISEFKRRSPSKDWIFRNANVDEVIPAYQKAGASALSILTDEKYFGGSMRDVRNARPLTDLPIIRKDFIIDEYQIYQAKVIGADAILLIAAAITREQCRYLTNVAHELNLEVLLEVHHEDEIDYTTTDVDMVGVNNRNLGSFHTDVANSFRLAELLPKNKLLVSESGLSNPETVLHLQKAGFKGFLMGEAFMKTHHPGEALSAFIEELK